MSNTTTKRIFITFLKSLIPLVATLIGSILGHIAGDDPGLGVALGASVGSLLYNSSKAV